MDRNSEYHHINLTKTENHMLVVVSKIKSMGKMVNLRIGMDFCKKLSEIVTQVVIASAKNATEDGMGTIKARHIPSEMTFK